MNEFDHLLELPGGEPDRAWIKERLETLSAREGRALAAAVTACPVGDLETAACLLNSLDDFEICFPAGSYEQLGEFSLRRDNRLAEEILPYADLAELGRRYEDRHPGLFVGSCYVAYPSRPIPAAFQENKLPPLWDGDWSVKLKLASPAAPEGVWLRLPDHDGNMAEQSGEVILALHELKVRALEDCALLEARCILPEAGDLMKQYDSIRELVRDGDSLGFALDEQGQGEPCWLEKFAAALEYEDCRSLNFALDIAQNLRCYEWVPGGELEDFAAEHLRGLGASEDLLKSGAVDLKRYAEDLLETSGYMQASGETGWLLRNCQEFIREHTAPANGQGGMTMQ